MNLLYSVNRMRCYPNDAGTFVSLLLGLLKHLIEIRKRPIFFCGDTVVGTLYSANFAYLRGLCSGQHLWVHRVTHPTCGDCIFTQYLWVHMAIHLTCGNYLHSIGRRQYTQIVLVG